MFDVEQRRRISIEELRDLLVGGQNIEAESEETGRDCTIEVLRRVMGGGSLDAMSGPGGLTMPGLGAMGAFGRLVEMMQVAGDRVDSADDRRRGDHRSDRWDAARDDRPLRARRSISVDWSGELTGSDGGSA